MTQESKAERRQKNIHRIHRIQGQLSALERAIEADDTCENIVIQAHAIEKAMSSLIQNMIGGYLEHQARELIEEDVDTAIKEIQRLFELLNR